MGAAHSHDPENVTQQAPTSTSPTANDSQPGLTSGELAAAIAVPIIFVVLAIATFLLVRYFRKRRSGFGSYNPNKLETAMGQSDGKHTPNTGLWVPPQERLFWSQTITLPPFPILCIGGHRIAVIMRLLLLLIKNLCIHWQLRTHCCISSASV